MPTMNISLPESLRLYVDYQVFEGKFSTASEFIRHLLREHELSTRDEREKQLNADIASALDEEERGETVDGPEAFRKIREKYLEIKRATQ